MQDTATSLIELGAVFFGLGILGRLAWKVGISPIPLYLVGGIAFGDGGLVPLHGIEAFTHLASEIGVVLLLLLLGLEYSAGELVTGLKRSWSAGLVDLVLNAAPGALVALLLGWGPMGALTMAGVTYISSSGIVAKVLGDLGRLGNRETPVVLSILVFEDLAMALYLPILTAVLGGVSLLGGLTAVGISLIVISVVLVVALKFGRYVSALVDSPDPEVFLLRLLGAALLVAGIASQLQVSAAVGSFLLGIAISGSTAQNATRMLEPLRDLFAAVFFVVFGLNTDPSEIPPVLGFALLLALVIRTKLHAFVALLVVSVVVGVGSGISPADVPALLEEGMGDTMGEIAIIVALGAMLGRLMQETGAAEVLSERLLAAFGQRRAPLAAGITALLFGIPVFFDVGFIIMLPLIYSVAQRSDRSVISIALPAVGGLAIMHAVLPPHPGPVAAAGL